MRRFFHLPTFLLATGVTVASDSVPQAITSLRAVSAEGKGHAAASAAWKSLATAEPAALPQILAGMDGANPLAKNWLQSAALAIGEKNPQKLPAEALMTFLQDQKHDALGRRLAYELLVKTDPKTPDRLLAGFIHDPSPLLRRDAVERFFAEGQAALKSGQKSEAEKKFAEALSGAREEDQVKKVAEELKNLGRKPDLVKHFGFLTQWKIIGPFHNDKGAGFAEVFPPEKDLNFSAKYPGKKGEVVWKDVAVGDEFGMLNFNKEIEMIKEVTAYAATEFVSDEDRTAEIRIGTNNAWKVWVNGQFAFGRDEYHRGIRIDQYKVPVQLKKGKNTILVKLCQDHQTETWTVEWHFQLRISDEHGNAIASK